MSKKNKFDNKYRSLTDLGKVFNLSAVQIGKKLKDLGLRESTGEPSKETLEKGLAVSTPLANGTPHYRWHFHKCRELLKQSGLKVDKSEKIRTILKEMLSIFKSEAMQIGGGMEHKLAIHSFFDCVEKLPLESELDQVKQIIGELKASKDIKEHFLLVVEANR